MKSHLTHKTAGPLSTKLSERLYVPLALSCAIAALFLLTNHSIPFANDGNCDPWAYFGRFFIGDQQPMFGTITRVGSRLPSIIVGYIATRLFHGVAADYVTFLILFVSAAVAVYHAARLLFGQASALFALVFFSTQPLVLSQFAVTYTAPSLTYTCIAFALAVTAAQARPGLKQVLLLLATGFFFGTAVHAHLYSLSYNFIVGLYCLDWGRRSPAALLRDALGKWALLLAGALVATAFFGLINMLFMQGDFLFFLKQYREIWTALVVEYRKPQWYLLGGRGAILLVSVAACFAQGIWVARRPPEDRATRATLTALVPFVGLLMMQFGYLLYGGITLEYDYYFAWLIAPLALVLAWFYHRAPLRPPLSYAVLAIFLAGCVAADFGRPDLVWQGVARVPASLFVATALAAVIICFLRFTNTAALLMLVLLVGLGATIRPEKMGLPVWEAGGHDLYARVRAGMEFLAPYRFPKQPKFWLSTGGAMGESYAYARSYNICLVDSALPRFLKPGAPGYVPDNEAFSPGDYLVMTAVDGRELGEALASLRDRGLRFQEMGQKTIAEGGLSYLIVAGQLH
jgi:hypothetical protein